jgi:hypothetical protein
VIDNIFYEILCYNYYKWTIWVHAYNFFSRFKSSHTVHMNVFDLQFYSAVVKRLLQRSLCAYILCSIYKARINISPVFIYPHRFVLRLKIEKYRLPPVASCKFNTLLYYTYIIIHLSRYLFQLPTATNIYNVSITFALTTTNKCDIFFQYVLCVFLMTITRIRHVPAIKMRVIGVKTIKTTT